MNREIKFRVWDLDKQTMVYPTIQHNEKYVMQLNCHYIGEFNGKKYNTVQMPLMQFTGLYDRNGGEIYEGDILTDDFGSIAVVVWYDTYAQFRLDYGEDDIHLFDGQQNEMTIFGNIYENPELLQENN